MMMFLIIITIISAVSSRRPIEIGSKKGGNVIKIFCSIELNDLLLKIIC